MPKEKSGLGVPNIYIYYIAFNARYPLTWGYNEKNHKIPGSWEWLEKMVLGEFDSTISLKSLWYNPKYKAKIHNQLIEFSCEITKTIQKMLKITGISLPSCPVLNNPLIIIGGKTLHSPFLSEDIIRMEQLVKDREILPFSVLKSQYHLSDSKIFQYLQLKSIIKSHLSKGSAFSTKGIVDEKLKKAVNRRGTVSALYKLLIQSLPDNTVSTKLQWEKDIGSTLTEEQWNTITRKLSLCSKCVHYKIIQIKIFHRAYVTPTTLKKMNPNVSELCWHGCGQIGTLGHLLWSCPSVKKLWDSVIEFMEDTLNLIIPKQFHICVLGNIPENLPKISQKVAGLGFMSAKRIILKNWKLQKMDCFDINNWVKDFMSLLSMESVILFHDINKKHNNEKTLQDVLDDLKRKLVGGQ